MDSFIIGKRDGEEYDSMENLSLPGVVAIPTSDCTFSRFTDMTGIGVVRMHGKPGECTQQTPNGFNRDEEYSRSREISVSDSGLIYPDIHPIFIMTDSTVSAGRAGCAVSVG